MSSLPYSRLPHLSVDTCGRKAQVTSSILADYRFQALQESNQNLVCKILENRDIFQEEIRDRVDSLWEMTESSLIKIVAKINERIPSIQETSAAVQRALLSSLRFLSITQRYEEIAEAHRSTFEWIFRPNESRVAIGSNFPEWLEFGSGVYWLNGKAASGKSTLMRYILDSGRASHFLERWADGHELEIVTFFFWASGTLQQRSLLGIFRSMLYQYLQNHPDEIQKILPEAYDLASRDHAFKEMQSITWTTPMLEKAFENMIVSTKQRRLCLFIDGLDEYEGDHAAMARFLIKIGKYEHVKICVSSRPWLQIENVFKSCPALRLQDLTENDIFIYVEDRLSANAQWSTLCEKQPDEMTKVIKEIVRTANGVFLWVKLILNSLIKGLDLDDDFEDLTKRLRCLPQGLDELYSHMLKTIDPPFYFEEAAMFFEILRTARQRYERAVADTHDVMSLVTLALADRKNYSVLSQLDSNVSDDAFLTTLCFKTESRLKSRCMGLLEVNGRDSKPIQFHRVSYIHRTLRDFLERPDIMAMIQGAIEDEKFSPNLSLLRSCVFQLRLTLPNFKTSPPLSIWRTVRLSIGYASVIEEKYSSELVLAMDQLDSIMTNHQMQYDDSNYHWSTEKSLHRYDKGSIGQQHDTFLSFCIEKNVSKYVRIVLQKDPSLVLGSNGRPLLDYAVTSLLDDPMNRSKVDMCKTLLDFGSPPNQAYNAVSPWAKIISHLARLRHISDNSSLVMQNSMWLDLIVAFIKRNSDLSFHILGDMYGEFLTARAVLQDLILQIQEPGANMIRSLLEEYSGDKCTTKPSARTLAFNSGDGLGIPRDQNADMRRGWLDLEQAHLAAKSSLLSVQRYGTFPETETINDSGVLLTTMKTMLCCVKPRRQ